MADYSMQKVKMKDSTFLKLSKFIYNNYGIQLPLSKKVMLESRLQRRLKANNFQSFDDYCEYLFTAVGQEKEVISMINVVSTNKTDFFREPLHFDFMTETLLPEAYENSTGELFKIWSSASSSGEEAYTIAMTMNEFNQDKKLMNYSILGTDISTDILEKAQKGIYDEQRIANIPLILKRKYFLRSKNRDKLTVRVIPELRKKVLFRRLNLMDQVYPVADEFDLVFCRNVLIYFDRQTQEKVVQKLCDKLKVGGYLFLGHSESLTSMDLPLKQIKPTIFKRI